MIKILVGQINPTVGDLSGNLELIMAAAREAQKAGADLAVFPELALTAYYPADLLDEESFLVRIEAAFAELVCRSRDTPDVALVIGLPVRRSGPGKPLFNALRVVRDGAVQLEYAKQCLPTYNVFDERRHFEPGPPRPGLLEIGGTRLGFMICEDGWPADYAVDPFDQLRAAQPELVISVNASPANIGKREQRHQVFGQAAARTGLPVLYVNQVGGHDSLIYDGGSFAMEASGAVTWEAPRFETALPVLEFGAGAFRAPQAGAQNAGLSHLEFYRQAICLGIRDYARRCGFRKVVVGSSGGIDSALTLALAVEALGPENVMAITMPSKFSSSGSVSDSVALARNLGIELAEHPILAIVAGYEGGFHDAFGQPLQGLALENLQARVRGTILMEYSNSMGHLLLTTGNKSEVSVGYCTLYGDTNGGLAPIADLYKTEVFALCRHLNASAGRELVPASIIDKPPSAELAPGQKDTDSLPPYEVLDQILKLHIEGGRLTPAELEEATQFVAALTASSEGAALVRRIHKMVSRNEYKRRQAPPILRLRGRAFGSGRQLPIAAVYP